MSLLRDERGITLVELLIVIVIIGLLSTAIVLSVDSVVEDELRDKGCLVLVSDEPVRDNVIDADHPDWSESRARAEFCEGYTITTDPQTTTSRTPTEDPGTTEPPPVSSPTTTPASTAPTSTVATRLVCTADSEHACWDDSGKKLCTIGDDGVCRDGTGTSYCRMTPDIKPSCVDRPGE